MHFLLPYLLLLITNFPTDEFDIVIKNGKVIDGTGNSWFYADVAIKNGVIVKVGKLNNVRATKIIDASNLIVTPGFIDVHTHIEDDEILNPLASNFIYDGVTTVVTGNCGSSRVDLKQYFALLDSMKLGVNVASLIGHNDVREAAMGRANRMPTSDELLQMKKLVEQAMKEGAVGLSTGLIYIPGTYAKSDEIVELAKIVANYGGLYASHMRDEGDSVIPAIEEALYIGKEASLPVEISHFKIGGQQNWGRSKETVALITKARSEGIEVTIDQYPYTASSTTLSTMLPDSILADGRDSVLARLKRPDVRKKVQDYLIRNLNRRKLLHFDYAVVASYDKNPQYNGKSIEKINLMKGRVHTAPYEAETIIELIEQGGAGMVFHGMSEDDVRYIMQYPFNMFASDASIRVFQKGAPHPRGYGTNARVLSKYVRDEKVIGLEEAIRRMTSLPAQKFQLKNRGLLKEGYAADIVIFDEKTVKDQSTFDEPHQYSTGFKYVVVNGKLSVENEKQSDVRNGEVLYGPGLNN